MPALRHSRPNTHHSRRRRSRGQSLLEFALIAPVLLALMGMCIDVARVYQAWINLESATRDAAQYIATSSTDPLDDNYGGYETSTKAQNILKTATGTTFTLNDPTVCTTPSVATEYSETTEKAQGASTAYPVSTARVRSCLPFKVLFPYPLLTTDGDFQLRSDRTYRVIVGR